MKRRRSAQPSETLVFGESDNDRESVVQLASALRPDLGPFRKLSSPLVLVKGVQEAKARKAGDALGSLVKARLAVGPVRAALVHEDCDAVEPAHVALAERKESLVPLSVPLVAVTPAWEMEAWWFLWPTAVVAVNPSWAEPRRSGSRVGLVENAKEELRRSLRPPGKGKLPRDYEESDSPKIARKVRELGIVGELDAVSDSFERFRGRLTSL